MIVRSFLSTAAVTLVLVGPAAAFTAPPVADKTMPLILAQAGDAEAHLRALEERIQQLVDEIEEAEEAVAEAERSGGDVEVVRTRLDEARDELRSAEEALREAAQELEAARELEATAEQERAAQQRDEEERAERERIEQERAEQERAEQRRADEEPAERERAEEERAEQRRADDERAEQERPEQRRADEERAVEERVEQRRADDERAEQERAEQQRADEERAERERAEEERVEQQRADEERAERERVERELADEERAEQQRADEERAERERAERDPAPRDAAPGDPPAVNREAQPDHRGHDGRDDRPSLQERMQERERAGRGRPGGPEVQPQTEALEAQPELGGRQGQEPSQREGTTDRQRADPGPLDVPGKIQEAQPDPRHPERRGRGEGREERPSLFDRMRGRDGAEGERREEPGVQATPIGPPTEIQEAQPERRGRDQGRTESSRHSAEGERREEPGSQATPSGPPAEIQQVQPERRGRGQGRAERPSIFDRMRGRDGAEGERREEPDAQATPVRPPAEIQEAQPGERGRGRGREGRPSLRERMQDRERGQGEQPAEPQIQGTPETIITEERPILPDAEPATAEETTQERRERRARRDRRSLQEQAEERERLERSRPETQQTRRQGARPQTAPGIASELPDNARILRRESDRLIFQRGDRVVVRKDETERMRRFSREMRTERLQGGWTRTVTVQRTGIQVITIWDEYGDIVERVRRYPNGREMVLIDTRELRRERGPHFRLDVQLPPVVVTIPREEYIVETRRASRAEIYAALTAAPVQEPPRMFTLQEVREIEQVRDLVPRIDLDTITFEFNSAEIPPDQLDSLEVIGLSLEDVLDENPDEIFLIEGHTDAVGGDLYNLALSDRRAEAVAFALSEYFDVPPENLVTQGYGKQFLKIPTQEAERENRRVTIRRITPLVSAD